MKVSIIIPTYRRSQLLIDALLSVHRQKLQALSINSVEIMIVDNAKKSIPQLRKLCNSTSKFTTRYIHEPQNGLHNARNRGAIEAQGDILVFIDDDVICPTGWLEAIINPFDDAHIVMVAGKVVPHYESTPPEWIVQFNSALSLLDLGNVPHAITPYGSAVGCNMAIRKNDLFAVGGFNPDGFGDRRLIKYRGDGEGGLSRKLHDNEGIIWYAPDAVLKHRISQKRMTMDYIKRRAENSGVEATFCHYRYNNRRLPIILLSLFALNSIMKSLCRRVQMLISIKRSSTWIHYLYSSALHWNAFLQALRILFSKNMQEHTKQISYLKN